MDSNIRLIVFVVVIVLAFGYLAKNLLRLYSYLKVAKPEVRWDNVSKRLAHTFEVAIFQSKILRDKLSGPIHAGIFWGFLVLLFSASEAVIQGFFPSFSWTFLGPLYTIITLLTDIFCVAILLAIAGALYRRFVEKLKRLQGDSHEKTDAVIVLSAIFMIVLSLLIENSSLTVLHIGNGWSFRPVSAALGSMMSPSSALIFFELGWWGHILFIFAFMNYLPFSKHLHVYTSIPNVFFSKYTPVNRLEPIDFEKEGVEKFGVVDIDDFKWKTLFDGYTCTHCGRCDSVCPANITGKVLSPRNVIVQVRNRTMDYGEILLKKAGHNIPGGDSAPTALTPAEEEIAGKKFVGDYENIEALWQCTTCGACMQECPVMIEHVPAIVDMRRSLVMMEANFPAELQSAFGNLENNATPWAFSAMERADWAQGAGIKTAAEHPDFDILFWVGCVGSFDDRAKKISLAFSRLMQAAGVNFAILGTEEQCNGDIARRAGNEYLADMLVKANIETLNRYNVKKIVTICPHCFNTIKNEYPDFGGKYEVIHHTSFLSELIDTGKLKLKKDSPAPGKITYHDSCYLGRYNNIYDEPRKILHNIKGSETVEVKRSHDKGLCCGAGGGQMFMEEKQGKRVNIERIEELLDTGANTIALNCPFCMTMITDGVKAKDMVDHVAVKDISEILLDYIEE